VSVYALARWFITVTRISSYSTRSKEGRIDADEVTRDREQVPVRVEDIAKVSKPFGIGVSRMSIMDPLSVTPVEEIA